jgi:hypothetical protein
VLHKEFTYSAAGKVLHCDLQRRAAVRTYIGLFRRDLSFGSFDQLMNSDKH